MLLYMDGVCVQTTRRVLQVMKLYQTYTSLHDPKIVNYAIKIIENYGIHNYGIHNWEVSI